MHKSPSQELPLQEESQACTVWEESCPGQLCGSTMWLCLHGDMGSYFPCGPAVKIWGFHSGDPGWTHGVGSKKKVTDCFQEHPHSPRQHTEM